MRTPHNDRLTSDIVSETPERKCILSGRKDARGLLIRLAIAPADANGRCLVLPDVLARAPGRGAWIGVTRGELDLALAKGKLRGALARSFQGAFHGMPMIVPEDLPDVIEAALIRVISERLGLEMRSGRLLTGSDRIAEQARMGKVAFLGHAADASADGTRKLDQAWRVGEDAEGSGQRGVILPLDRARLSVALGRENVVHLALTDPAAAERLGGLLRRLTHFRGGSGVDEPGGEEPGVDEPGVDEPGWDESGEGAASPSACLADIKDNDMLMPAQVDPRAVSRPKDCLKT
jgi:predicted RNA-binding protein YlxR (DUF448 family)